MCKTMQLGVDKKAASRWRLFCKAFWGLYDALVRYLAFIPTFSLLVISFIIVADVVSRYAFNAPFKNTTPIAELILVLILSFGGSHLLQTEGFITVDIIVGLLSKKARLLLNSITGTMSGIVFGMVGFYASTKAIYLIRTKSIIINSGGDWLHAIYAIPLVLFYFLVMVQFFRQSSQSFLEMKSIAKQK